MHLLMTSAFLRAGAVCAKESRSFWNAVDWLCRDAAHRTSQRLLVEVCCSFGMNELIHRLHPCSTRCSHSSSSSSLSLTSLYQSPADRAFEVCMTLTSTELVDASLAEPMSTWQSLGVVVLVVANRAFLPDSIHRHKDALFLLGDISSIDHELLQIRRQQNHLEAAPVLKPRSPPTDLNLLTCSPPSSSTFLPTLVLTFCINSTRA